MKVTYDSRFVPAHDMAFHGQVLLMNEAPGPDEAASGIPLYGQQGANLYHALRAAGIVWALDHKKFIWPTNDAIRHDLRQNQKKSFLSTRAKYITCTNSYPYWPKPNGNSGNFCPPLKEDVSAKENIERIRKEILPTHSVLLVCGNYAYIACTGEELSQPSQREFTNLTEDEIRIANSRLSSNFKNGLYMGHTRRWSMNRKKTNCSLQKLAVFLSWSLSNNIQ